jgi:hypothetical protein
LLETNQAETRDEVMDALFGVDLDSVAEEMANADAVEYAYDPSMAPVATSIPCAVTVTAVIMC